MFHVDGTGFDLAGRALGHALVRAHITVGGVFNHQRAVVKNLVLGVVVRTDFIAFIFMMEKRRFF